MSSDGTFRGILAQLHDDVAVTPPQIRTITVAAPGPGLDGGDYTIELATACDEHPHERRVGCLTCQVAAVRAGLDPIALRLELEGARAQIRDLTAEVGALRQVERLVIAAVADLPSWAQSAPPVARIVRALGEVELARREGGADQAEEP